MGGGVLGWGRWEDGGKSYSRVREWGRRGGTQLGPEPLCRVSWHFMEALASMTWHCGLHRIGLPVLFNVHI